MGSKLVESHYEGQHIMEMDKGSHCDTTNGGNTWHPYCYKHKLRQTVNRTKSGLFANFPINYGHEAETFTYCEKCVEEESQ